MKNFVKNTTILALLMVTVAVSAKTPKMSSVSTDGSKSILVSFTAPSTGLKVQLLDSDENIIYSELLNEGEINKKFNLKDLEEGTYYLSANDFVKSSIYTIVLKGGEVLITNTKEVIKPFFRKEGKMVYLNFLNLTKDEISVKVYDEDNRIVFTEKLTDDMIVEKAFNFKDAYSGVYTLMVSSASGTHSEEFVVN